MGGFFGIIFESSGGGGSSLARLGARLAYASPAGSIAATPVGFNSLTGRLLVTLPSGNAAWTSLTAGADGQLLEIKNTDVTNSLTLPQVDWNGVGDITLTPGNNILVYYDSTVGAWQVTAP